MTGMHEENMKTLKLRKGFWFLLAITVVSLAAFLLLNWRITVLEQEYDRLNTEYWDIINSLSLDGQEKVEKTTSVQAERVKLIFDRQNEIEKSLRRGRYSYRSLCSNTGAVLLFSGTGTFFVGIEWLNAALRQRYR